VVPFCLTSNSSPHGEKPRTGGCEGRICSRVKENEEWVKQDSKLRIRQHYGAPIKTIVAMEKQRVLHILSVFVALGIRHAMCMPLFVVCGLSGSTVFFHIISLKPKKKIIENKMWVLILSVTFSATFLILSRIQRDTIKMFIGLHVKYPLFLSDFNETSIS
jgi:hypothetical protein